MWDWEASKVHCLFTKLGTGWTRGALMQHDGGHGTCAECAIIMTRGYQSRLDIVSVLSFCEVLQLKFTRNMLGEDLFVHVVSIVTPRSRSILKPLFTPYHT